MTKIYRFKAYFTMNEEPAMYKDFETLLEAEKGPEDLKHLAVIRYKISEIELDKDENVISETIITTMNIYTMNT